MDNNKELDLEIADTLEEFVNKFSYYTDQSKIGTFKRTDYVSALRYAIATLRGGSDNDSK